MNFKHFLREMRKKLIVSVFRIKTKLEIYLKNSGYLKKRIELKAFDVREMVVMSFKRQIDPSLLIFFKTEGN